ncbi:myo-inositol 2-dehydrogenase/D-chiro-inositol 1-dehydrogenase [Erwinia toletana]|uniref:Myo-inositol 2-dehydrogenase/D-chiro-inositol 1-dehydrogenase n=1 Tax=Winslowiella toletana TaxID=92490 RepID=A0ABS4PEI7_9GAMM|nr:Gfo/Idh/MocA family oxidoreductase [Winslowiella toletana]MBP2171054.1 myo-inositol 2-dehydrogenase/D-chiro-inositol 1-dehydrogenase [Winslowiella toletana]
MAAKQRFALLGSGFIGQVHAQNLAAHPQVELALVADPDAARAQAVAGRYGAQVADVTQAINSDAIDAVLIASATPSHAELLAAAARAGKAIYCEKPIDLSLDRAKRVVEKVLPFNLPITVGFNRRFDNSHQQLKRHLQQGAIGRTELIQMVCRASEMPPLSYLQASGGQMRDQAIHFFDLLRWLTEDEVSRVGALGAALALPEISAFGDVDTSVLIMQMNSGALAQLDNTRRTGYGYDERISVIGERGMAESASQCPQGATLWQGSQVTRPGLWPDWFSRVRETYYQHLDAFVRQLNGEAVADLPGLVDGLQAQAIAEAAVQSLAEKRFCNIERIVF